MFSRRLLFIFLSTAWLALKIPINSNGSENIFDYIRSNDHFKLLKHLENPLYDLNIFNDQGESPIFMAIMMNSLFATSALLKDRRTNPNLPSLNGLSPLHVACQVGDIAIVKELLSKTTVDVNISDFHGHAAIFFAASKGRREVVLLLLAQRNLFLAHIEAALWQAVHLAYLEIIRDLLIHLGDQYYELKNEDGFSPFFECFYSKRENVIIFWLSDEALPFDPFEVDQSIGQGLLHFAVRNEMVEVIGLLNKRTNVDVNAVDRINYTPLHYAVLDGNPNIISSLLEFPNVDIFISSSAVNSVAFMSVALNREQVFKLISLDTIQPLLNEMDLYGNSILHHASFNGIIHILRMIQSSEDVQWNLRNDFEQTPLHMAVLNGSLDIVKILLANQYVNPFFRDFRELNPAYLACLNGSKVLVDEFIETYPMIFDDSGPSGNTLSHWSAMHDWEDLVGQNFNSRNVDHETPLHIACAYNSHKSIDLLLSIPQVDVAATDVKGNSALHFAARSASLSVIVKVLQRFDSLKITLPHLHTRNSLGESPLLILYKQSKFAELSHLLLNPHIAFDYFSLEELESFLKIAKEFNNQAAVSLLNSHLSSHNTL